MTRPRSACAAPLLLALSCAFCAPVASAAGEQVPLPEPVLRVLQSLRVPADRVSAFVQAVDEGAPLVAANADVPRNPASAMKIVTTYAALELLGPAFEWHTRVYLDGAFANGRLDGHLVLEGGGDPWLTTERFWKLLRELRARGLQHVDGDFVVDDGYFALDEASAVAFDGQPHRTYNVVPDALLVNFKAARFLFRPDATNGTVFVDVDPPLPNLTVNNRVRLVDGPCAGYQRGIAFDMPGGSAAGLVALSGKFPRGCTEFELWRAVLEPHTFAFGVFQSLWTELGGTFAGTVRRTPAPDALEPFFDYPSITLAEVVRHVNKFSNNAMARTLLLTIAAERRAVPGTVANGRAVIGEWLTAKGIDTTGLHIVNGAGLSRDARITARLLARVLLDAWRSPYQAELVASLPIGGMDGTLRTRLGGNASTGRSHLKTGRLEGVVAIAGYVHAADGRNYVVVALDNSPDAHRGAAQEWQERLVAWVHAR